MARQRSAIPWVEQHPNGIWYAHWYDDADRRTRRESLGTKEAGEATALFARWLTEGGPARDRRPAGLNASHLVGQILDAYYVEHVEHKVVDQKRQAQAIVHLKAFFRDTFISDVDVNACRAYAIARRDGAIGGGKRRSDARGTDSTIRRELGVLGAAANHALSRRRIAPDKMPSVERPSEPRTTTVQWLTKEQIRAALDKADGKLRDFILIAYYTGARRASIENLRCSQIDLKHGVIDLQPAGGSVTKKRRPKVPLFPEIRPTIERLMIEANGGALLGENMYVRFVALMDSLGVEAHPHMLRHSRASHLLMDGEPIFKVARLLGDTVATVERVYAHVLVDFLNTDSNLGVA